MQPELWLQLRASFLTDAAASPAMHARLAGMAESLLHGLDQCLQRTAALESAGSQPLPSLRASSNFNLKPVGSLDIFGSSSPMSHQHSMTMPEYLGQMPRRQDSSDSSRVRLDGQLGLSGH